MIFPSKQQTRRIHVRRQVGLADYLLHTLEPEMFSEKMAEGAWYEKVKVDLVCFALRIQRTASLPTLGPDKEQDNIYHLAAALSQHYKEI